MANYRKVVEQFSECSNCGLAISVKFGRRYCSKKCLEVSRLKRDGNISCTQKTGSWKDFATVREIRKFNTNGMMPLRFRVEKCEACLAPFTPVSKRHKTCCKECKSEITKEYQRKWQADRRKDHSVRLFIGISSAISKMLSKLSTSRKSRTAILLGMSGCDFMNYLLSHENNKDGIFTKENYGKVWHVDHIRPLASFDLTDEKQQKIAFHFTNCQPLCAKKNMQKGSLWNGIRYNHISGRS